jgi:hypothetical protein
MLSLKAHEPLPILDSLSQNPQTPALATFSSLPNKFAPLFTKLQICPSHNTLKGLVLYISIG